MAKVLNDDDDDADNDEDYDSEFSDLQEENKQISSVVNSWEDKIEALMTME